MGATLFLSTFILLSKGVQAFTWNSKMAPEVSACVGDQVHFPWRYTVSARKENVDNVTWLLGTTDLFNFRQDDFLFGTEAMERNKAALLLKKASVGDAGNYTVQVTVTEKDGAKTIPKLYARSVSLMVSESPTLSGNRLRAWLDPMVVRQAKGNQTEYTALLYCGIFQSLGEPAVSVMWKTPEGKIVPSTSYSSGRFQLSVPIPVGRKKYTCYINQSAANACMKRSSPLRQPANVRLNAAVAQWNTIQVRLSDFESELQQQAARQADLETDNNALRKELKQQASEQTDLETDYNALKTELKQQASKQTDLETDNNALRTELKQQASQQTKLKTDNNALRTELKQQASKQTDLETDNNALRTELQEREKMENQTRVDLENTIQDFSAHSTQLRHIVLSLHCRLTQTNSPSSIFRNFCEKAGRTEGWLIILRRHDGSVSFHRNWNEYENGFGNLNGEYWLGLLNIHRLTAQSGMNYKLRVKIRDYFGNSAYDEYQTFRLNWAADKYRLYVKGHSGTAGNCLAGHNGSKFSTYDQDNDRHSRAHCARDSQAGWWYSACYCGHLTSVYARSQDDRKGHVQNSWGQWRAKNGEIRALQLMEMMVRPAM